MTIEIVDFPIKHGDFPVRYVKLPEGITIFWDFFHEILHESPWLSWLTKVAWPHSQRPKSCRGFCGGYSVAGDAEAASGNSCPTGEGGCLTNEAWTWRSQQKKHGKTLEKLSAFPTWSIFWFGFPVFFFLSLRQEFFIKHRDRDVEDLAWSSKTYLKVAHHPKPTPSRYAMGTSQTMHGLDFLLENSSMFIWLAKFIMLRHHHHHQNSSAYINVLDPKTRHMINVYHAHLQMSNMSDLGRFTAVSRPGDVRRPVLQEVLLVVPTVSIPRSGARFTDVGLVLKMGLFESHREYLQGLFRSSPKWLFFFFSGKWWETMNFGGSLFFKQTHLEFYIWIPTVDLRWVLLLAVPRLEVLIAPRPVIGMGVRQIYVSKDGDKSWYNGIPQFLVGKLTINGHFQ